MKLNDIAIDLETLSTRPDAAIVAIAATEFDRNTGTIGGTYYVKVALNSAINDGHVDGDTLGWWYNQSSDAKTEIFGGDPANKRSILAALTELRGFVERVGDTPCVWGNGSSFDITILESAFNRNPAAGDHPWEYRNVRDMRTLVDMAQTLGFDRTSVPFVGTVHNAMHDSIHQAKVISAAWQFVTNKAPVDTGI